MGCVIFGPEETLLLGGNGKEYHRAVGTRSVGPHACLLNELRDAGAVVDGAVVDAIAPRIRLADAEVVPVRRVDDRLVGPSLTFQDPDDIVALDDLRSGAVMRRERRLQGHWLEIRVPCLGTRLLEVDPRALEQLNGERSLDPAFHLRVMAGRIFTN